MSHFRKSVVISISLIAMTAGCDSSDKDKARKRILTEVRDPESASFRNERIRTLWTKDGARKIVYCAEINSNNAYGGKTGFQPVMIDIASHDGSETKNPPTLKGLGPSFGYIPSYILDCERADTERPNGTLFLGFTNFYSSDEERRQAVDKAYPIISNQPAPD